MTTSIKSAVEMYLRARNPARGTRSEYQTTMRKWHDWKGRVPLEKLDRLTIRKFLSWVYDRARADGGSNPGRTANKARTHLRAVISWAWESDLIEVPPRFPKLLPAREVAGRHYLTKAEINALYFATHEMPRPRGWRNPVSVGRYGPANLFVSSSSLGLLR